MRKAEGYHPSAFRICSEFVSAKYRQRPFLPQQVLGENNRRFAEYIYQWTGKMKSKRSGNGLSFKFFRII